MEGNIISFKVFVNSKGQVMSEYSKLPVEKLGTIFEDDDIPLVKKILNEVDTKVGSLHSHLEKELEALN
jgi:hypothetical protein|tara:strand:+ start:228 stop:434 length:207 start_codon:yes stop_codon:yes gene_type:complete